MRDHLGNFMVSSNLQFARGILLLDDCEGTCTWQKSGTDANVAVTFETAAAFMGTTGLQLFSGDADPAADDIATAYKATGFPESGLVVCRARIASPDLTKVKQVWWGVSVIDGTTLYDATVRWVPNTPAFAYRDTAGDWQAIAALAYGTYALNWCLWELVVDVRAMAYRSVLFNGTRVDLAGIGLYDQGAVAKRELQIGVSVVCLGAAAATLYLDTVYAGEFLEV
jgi:hypothetical protein